MSAFLLLIALLAAAHIETDEACRQKVDLCLDIDASSTVCGGNEPCENWETVLQFSKNITNTLDIGSALDRVALVTFANTTEVKWDLRQYTAMNPLLTAIGGVAFKGGVFNNLTSANDVVTKVYSPAAGDDVDLLLLHGRKNLILMITDGIPSVSDVQAKATSIGVQRYGITIFVVCILTGCTESWANATATSPEKPDQKTYFLVDSYSKLYSVIETVLENICYFLENPPTPTPPVKINVNLTVG